MAGTLETPARSIQDKGGRGIIGATANVAEAEPASFAGVRLVDRFSNTLPWPASSQMPARVIALSHHPYCGRKVFPEDKSKGAAINTPGLPDRRPLTALMGVVAGHCAISGLPGLSTRLLPGEEWIDPLA
jgi:hypothetical protein